MTQRACVYLANKNVSIAYSSPQPRAKESLAFLSEIPMFSLSIDSRLKDFVASNYFINNYRERIEEALKTPTIVFANCETINHVTARLYSFLDEMINRNQFPVVVSTHGVCAAIMINRYTHEGVVELWKKMKVGELVCLDIRACTAQEIDY